MPMIGARFYAQLEASQMRNDMLENELTKASPSEFLRLVLFLGKLNSAHKLSRLFLQFAFLYPSLRRRVGAKRRQGRGT